MGPQGPKGDKGDAGEQGPTGLTGPKGDKGDQGTNSETIIITNSVTSKENLSWGTKVSSEAHCPVDMKIISGGVNVTHNMPEMYLDVFVVVSGSYPSDNGWVGIGTAPKGTGGQGKMTVVTSAICSK
jgi:hypothetical protein